MGEWYVITVKGIIGPDKSDGKEFTILGRKLTVMSQYLTYEPDAKHVRILCAELGLKDDSNGLESPIVKRDVDGGNSNTSSGDGGGR